MFREHPRLGYDITWLSAHEEGHVDDNLLTAGRRNATERVAMLLMHLYRRLDRIGLVEDGSVAFPLNQQHIADALGLSLVHTNKTLRRLSLLGLHELKNGRLAPAQHPRAGAHCRVLRHAAPADAAAVGRCRLRAVRGDEWPGCAGWTMPGLPWMG